MLPTLLGDQFLPVSSKKTGNDLVFRLYRLGQSDMDSDEQVFACFVKINDDHEITSEEEVRELAKLLSLLGVKLAS